MSAGIYAIEVEQGATFTFGFTVTDADSGTPRDWSAYTMSGSIRNQYDDAQPLANFVLSGSLDTTGKIGVMISAATTSLMPAPTEGVYDINMHSGSYVERVLEGTVKIKATATK